MDLTQGGNAPVPNQTLTVRVLSGAAVDVSAFRLFANGKVQGDADMVFYGQPQNDDRSLILSGGETNTAFAVNVPALRADVEKVAFTVTCDNGQIVSQLRSLTIQVEQNGNVLLRGPVELNGRSEAALILGELYRRNGEWKFRFVAQGFNGGLKPLAQHFGVNVADDPAPAPTPTPTPAPAPQPEPVNKVSLSKVSLTKEKPSVSLAKQDNFGEIRINLNWHRGTVKKGFMQGLLGGGNGVDLDLGAFVQTQDGRRDVVQALGDCFGSYNSAPYVQLQGDDRTGDVSEGEWLHINGREWKNIKEVLIYAFIYKGVPNWDSTDGVVTVHIPGQPPIETRLTEGQSGKGMSAIARLVNENGTIKVERINRYFNGHKAMDDALGWGFRWTAGSK
ncbi:tellurium resistance protein TerA [Affinibrenneria salicis]|uniref:Tellurium resistance protein TerA n=1 Tax=Affinibrenneria salicis TaxID=2590031 RepID=A0A5J5G0F2_9GAMM|nr:TerD family protein [Affinibrenneria salicis]KAA8999999.1 tellurium resistance protein TerA [Affinibrenneria salicis]